MRRDHPTLIIQHDICGTTVLTRSEGGNERVRAVDLGPDGLVGLGVISLQATHSLVVGPTTMERILSSLVYPADGTPRESVDVKGRDAQTAGPRIVTVTRIDFAGFLDTVGQRICDAVCAELASELGAPNPVRIIAGDAIPSEVLAALGRRGLRVELSGTPEAD